MAAHTEHSEWPIHCHACRELRSANIQKEPISCLSCGSEDLAIYGRKVENIRHRPDSPRCIASWGDYTHDDAAFECPRCLAQTLVFHPAWMMFD